MSELIGLVRCVRAHTLRGKYLNPPGPVKVPASREVVFASNWPAQVEAERERRQLEANRNREGYAIHEDAWMMNQHTTYEIEPVDVMPGVPSPS